MYMNLHTKIKTTTRAGKRVGHGYGSGKGGHNSGRGSKGQKARNRVPAYFVGSSWVWFKRLPFIRGKSKFSPLNPTVTLTAKDLNTLKDGTIVNAQSLYEAGIIPKSVARVASIKLVGTGKIERKLTLEITASESATKKVIEAGGEVRGQNS